MAQVMHGPRGITRLVFGNAIRMAVTDGERNELLAALQWHESVWQALDAQAQPQADEAGKANPAG